jgi:hypothetical protein
LKKTRRVKCLLGQERSRKASVDTSAYYLAGATKTLALWTFPGRLRSSLMCAILPCPGNFSSSSLLRTVMLTSRTPSLAHSAV